MLFLFLGNNEYEKKEVGLEREEFVDKCKDFSMIKIRIFCGRISAYGIK